ncbi:hypothetical protein BKA56DRAFT_608931 [Ilyonectria sp. MPI-CAGE-AT-0026]|nr:hypothetical protein BKA56DRAFT_608931 [Ilyonectria sp. MPI-CAGE-AT-0026]
MRDSGGYSPPRARDGNGGNGPKALESNKVPLPEPASGSVGAGRIQDFTAGRGPGGGANVRRGGSALLLLALSRVGVAWKMRADRHLRWSFACRLPPAKLESVSRVWSARTIRVSQSYHSSHGSFQPNPTSINAFSRALATAKHYAQFDEHKVPRILCAIVTQSHLRVLN